jgi:hypothetical protein
MAALMALAIASKASPAVFGDYAAVDTGTSPDTCNISMEAWEAGDSPNHGYVVAEIWCGTGWCFYDIYDWHYGGTSGGRNWYIAEDANGRSIIPMGSYQNAAGLYRFSCYDKNTTLFATESMTVTYYGENQLPNPVFWMSP